MEHRVVVTGLGAISALGLGVPALWQGLCAGIPGIRPLDGVGHWGLRSSVGAKIGHYDPTAHFDVQRLELLDRFSQLALVSAREAIADSGWSARDPAAERTGVILGNCSGGVETEDAAFRSLYGDGRARVSPFSIPRIMANAPASLASMEFGFRGPNLTISTACASSAHAIAQGALMVRHGIIDRALVGGSDAPFGFGYLKAWDALRVTAPDTCRPFSKQRQGMVLGEAGAMLALETRESARARGAPIHGEVTGFFMNGSAHHLTQPDSPGTERALRGALQDAGIQGPQVVYLNAHGTGTPLNDMTEAVAIRTVFGAHADRLPVSSTKSSHGHTLGAAGALEAVITVLALKHGLAPPTLNFIEPDPACPIDVVVQAPRPISGEYGLSTSLGFGGTNAVLVFRRDA